MKTTIKKVSTWSIALCAALLFSCSDASKRDDGSKNDWDHNQPADNVDNAATEIQDNADHATVRTEETVQDAKNSWRRERDEMRADIDRRIERNNSDIEQLKADARTKKKEAKREYDEKVNNLESRNHTLREKYNTYKAESKEDWENFKKEFNHDMDELGDAIQDLFRDNKKNK
jgi:hypothetical protein